MNEILNYKKILLQVLMCIAIFPFSLLKYPYLIYILIYGVLLINFLLRWMYFYKTIQTLSIFISLMFLFVFVFWITLTTIHSGDFIYYDIIVLIFRKLMLYLSLAFCVVSIYKEPSIFEEKFIKYVINSVIIYITITIVFTIFPTIKQSWFDFIYISNHEKHLLATNTGYAMRIGWDGFSGFRSTLACCIASLFTSILFLVDKYTPQKYILTMIYLLLGNAFYGRTGILVTIIFILFSMFIKFKKTLSYLPIALFLSLIFYLVFILAVRKFGLGNWFYWATTPFVNRITTGETSNRSVHVLESWYKTFDPDLITLIFGVGSLSDSKVIYTDVGWMRLIYQGGLIALVLAYTITLLPSFFIRRKYNYFPFLTIIMLFVFELKGDVFYDVFPFLFTLLFLNVLSNYFKKIKVSIDEV